MGVKAVASNENNMEKAKVGVKAVASNENKSQVGLI